MQGYSHALSGATAWLAISSGSGAALGWEQQTPAVAAAGAVLCAGAALLPDVDHPDGTIAWSLPSVTAGRTVIISSPTRLLCQGVSAISGGHRHGTHSTIGIAVFTAITYAASLLIVDIHGRAVPLGVGLLAVLLVAFAAKPLGLARQFRGRKGSISADIMGSWLGVWVLALGTAGAATWFLDYRWTWLPLAVALGATLHCVGDSLTTGGVPWLWPVNPKAPEWLRNAPVVGVVVRAVWLNNGYFRLPLLGDTDSIREKVFGVIMGLYLTYVGFYEVFEAYGTQVLY